jgi:hypothetical protein
MCGIIAVVTALQCAADAKQDAKAKFEKTVLAFLKQTVADKIASQKYTEITGVPIELYTQKVTCDFFNANRSKGRYFLQQNALPYYLHERRVTYTWLRSQANKDPDAKRVADAVYQEVENMRLQLGNVRTIKPVTSYRWAATLKFGKEIYPVSFHIVSKSGQEPHVEFSEIDRIQWLPEPVIKPLSFKQVDMAKIEQFKKEYYAANGLEKNEFETDDEHKARVLAGRIKAYKNFKATKIGDQVFEINCDIEDSLELKFDVNKQTLNCFGLFMALTDFTSKYPYISDSPISSFGDDAYPEIDFAGVLKSDPIYGNTLFRCSVAEAQQIKQGLGNTWNYSKLKLWLKFSPNTMHFHIVKIFIMPSKKS